MSKLAKNMHILQLMAATYCVLTEISRGAREQVEASFVNILVPAFSTSFQCPLHLGIAASRSFRVFKDIFSLHTFYLSLNF